MAMHRCYQTVWIRKYAEALESIPKGGFDVCMLDYQLEDGNGLELLKRVVDTGVQAPIIMFTGHQSRELDEEALRSGAMDYLVKGQFDSNVLDRSIRYALERFRTLQELRESEERYALAAEAANDGLWDWNLRNNQIYFSARWKSMLGYSETEISTTPDEWLERIHEDDRERVTSRIYALQHGRNDRFDDEHRIRHSDGDYRWFLCRGIAVHDKDGTAYRVAGSLRDIHDRKLSEEQLRYESMHDPLTGLLNRRHFLERLATLIQSARRHDQPLCFCMCDLDYFKSINDNYGHHAGDDAMRLFARTIREQLRAIDLAGRYGGDEFCIACPMTKLEDAATTLDRVRVEVARQTLKSPGGDEFSITGTFGLTELDPSHKQDSDLLDAADQLLYRAKHTNRNSLLAEYANASSDESA